MSNSLDLKLPNNHTILFVTIYTFHSETADQVVVGQKSSTADDAQSLATCPKGYVVTHCEAQSGD